MAIIANLATDENDIKQLLASEENGLYSTHLHQMISSSNDNGSFYDDDNFDFSFVYHRFYELFKRRCIHFWEGFAPQIERYQYCIEEITGEIPKGYFQEDVNRKIEQYEKSKEIFVKHLQRDTGYYVESILRQNLKKSLDGLVNYITILPQKEIRKIVLRVVDSAIKNQPIYEPDTDEVDDDDKTFIKEFSSLMNDIENSLLNSYDEIDDDSIDIYEYY